MAERPIPEALTNATHYQNRPEIVLRPRQIPAGFEMIELVTGGRGWVAHAGDWLEGTAGCLFWHAPGDQTIARSDPDDPYRCLAVLFQTPALEGRCMPRLTHWPEQDEVRSFTREVLHRFVDESFNKAALCVYVFGRLCYQAACWQHRTRAPAIPSRLLTMLTRIDTHYSDSLTVEDLALDAGWSVPHLHARCREYLESSPHQLLMARRLRAAKEMLASTDMPIKQVAAECGYASDAAFSRQFKIETGMTPGEYHRRHAYPLAAPE